MKRQQLLSYHKADIIEAGCDEAGRGCLAGPVFAAAVILAPDFENELLNDSKKLTEKQRYQLRPLIENEALAWAVELVSNSEIDEINILNASFLAMNRAVQKLKVTPEHLLIDGNRFQSNLPYAYRTIIRGDELSLSISCASIIAKVTRDRILVKYDKIFPEYGFKQHKGYPTAKHKDALRKYGYSKIHRRSFKY